MPGRDAVRADVTPLFHAVGGVSSLAISLAACFALYQMLGSDFWVRALGGKFPAAAFPLFDVSLVKALEVLLAVLAVHALLAVARIHHRDLVAPASSALVILSVSVIGFLAGSNNAATAAPGLAGEWRAYMFAAAIFFSVAAIASLYFAHSAKCFAKLRTSLAAGRVSI